MGAMKKAKRVRDTPPIATLTKFQKSFAFAFAHLFQKSKKTLRIASQENRLKI